MPLPYSSIGERHSPDDVLSADHMQLLVDKANDADDLLQTQHGDGIGARAGLHIGYAPPVHVGTLIVEPPPAGVDKPTIQMLAGYIDAGSLAWELGNDPDMAGAISPSPSAQYYFSFTTPGDRYRIVAAEVQVSFSDVASLTGGGVGKSNMMMIHPAVQVSVAPGELGKSRVQVYFGPDYATGQFILDLEQFTVLIHGIPRGG